MTDDVAIPQAGRAHILPNSIIAKGIPTGINPLGMTLSL